MTNIVINNTSPQKVSYYDGQNIIKDGGGNYYLIAQVGPHQAILFRITDKMEWNRKSEPVQVNWNELDTDIIGKIFNLNFPIVRVRSKITIELEGDGG